MNIYTITCHRPYNYGSVLQTYALNSTLCKMGYDAQVIDYIPPYLRDVSAKYRRNYLVKYARKFIYLPDFIKGKKVFNEFLNNYVKLTPKAYHSIEELNSLTEGEIYITGSDQVWNSSIKTGKDKAYYLTFAPSSSKKISYAASMAMDTLTEDAKIRYRSLLGDFSSISVREQTSADLLTQAGLSLVQTVLDPVFLLSPEHWLGLANPIQTKEKYILVYAFSRPPKLFKYAKKLAKQTGYKVYVLSTQWRDKIPLADSFFWCPTPNQFLYLIANAEQIVTNSFHGMCFSILFNKQFYVFKKGKEGNTRMLDLMASLGLQDQLVERVMAKEDISIDYVEPNLKLTELIQKSYTFLYRNLK